MNPDDVTRAVSLSIDTLSAALKGDWNVPAGPLTWTCWETAEHMADDLFTYAAQLAPPTPSTSTYLRFGWQHRRPAGPGLTVFVDPAEGTPALLEVLESCGAMLAAVVTAAPPEKLSFHNYGASNASGFAAMGVVEVLVHTNDIALGLDLPWTPPAELCAGALGRLFPWAPTDTDPWQTLLWATGRSELPGHEPQTSWRWNGAPA
ncbi:hypothetical protein [Paractinoplanes atraurantiacus]|uniref:Mycothiol maleylpyruvate isomerase N-terminal domain-containing protein n=1 Tax=Paractinoplanes atraurantiacus TaxID=1036182 RepID=A0A285F2C1_9ACTN|nr:hypothetical protein [Actinoplanes atraurantiacus]SNY04834.1 hypothetical protein SAMN05421748_101329 [Actinoplanes atraurantiacus]